jgi:hypothetical protein
LGVAIGTDVLAFDTNLQAFVTAFTLPTTDGTSWRRLWLQTDRAPSALEVQAFQLVRPSQWQLFLAEEKINGSPEYR